MSFANFDLESQRPVSKQKDIPTNFGKQSSSQNELDNIINKTSNQLQLFGNLISQFDSQKRQIGSRRDCLQLRDNIDESISKINDMGNAIQILIQNLSRLINKKSNQKSTVDNEDNEDKLQITNRQVLIKERLVNEFNELHKQFQKSIKVYNEKKRNYPINEQSPTDDQVDERSPLIKNDEQRQQQVQVQKQTEDLVNETELQYHILLTEERNREINQITEGISEVNTIFKDLGELVHQQGEQLDTIEDNILQLHGNTQQAERELSKAHEYQKKKGKWSCILLVALCIFVLVVVLAVVS